MIYKGVVACPKCNSRDFVMERCSVCNEPVKRREYFIGRPLHVTCAASLMRFDGTAVCPLCNGQTGVELGRLTWNYDAGEPYAGHVICSSCGKPNLMGWQNDFCTVCTLPILRCTLPATDAIRSGKIHRHYGCSELVAKTTTRASGCFGSMALFFAALLTSVVLFERFLR